MNDPQNKKSKTRQKNEDLILAAAEQVFAQLGFAGATTKLIAARAGLPKANLHYYFPTKKVLYDTVISKIFTIWLEAAETFDDCDDPADALTRYIHAKMDISRRHPLGSKVWAQEIMHGAPEIQDFLDHTMKRWTVSRVKIIERWIAQGKIAPVEPYYLLYMIWATTQHYADFEHQINTLGNVRRLSDAQFAKARATVTSIILGGIGLSEPPGD